MVKILKALALKMWLTSKCLQIHCLFKCPVFPCSSCFRYLLLCMARHAGSSTPRDYCQCNWLFQAWFDTSLLSDPHTSLLLSVMEIQWDSHETFPSSYLLRNRLLRFVSILQVSRESSIFVERHISWKYAHISIIYAAVIRRKLS